MPHGKGYKSTTKDSKPRKAPSKPTKKQEPEQTIPKTSHTITSLPLELQQSLLNIFNYTFPHLLNPSASQDIFKPLLQELKGHLFDRNFAAAFGKKEYLEVYAARWSPSRALGYSEILKEAIGQLGPADSAGNEGVKNNEVRIICLGGGAGAEIVGLAGAHVRLNDAQSTKKKIPDKQNLDTPASDGPQNDDDTTTPATPPPSSIPSPPTLNFDITLIDIADWSTISASLHNALTTPPQLSSYASEAAKAASKALAPASQFHARFIQQDVISPSFSISSVLSPSPMPPSSQPPSTLVTLMFTLNELYTTSLPRTQTLLINLTLSLPSGSLLLIVDSPGSYSTVTINNNEKKYPMLWLLEHTLFTTLPQTIADMEEDGLKNGAGEGKPVGTKTKECWEKVVGEESRWFRLPEGLRYPIELENMRCQMHLYRRV